MNHATTQIIRKYSFLHQHLVKLISKKYINKLWSTKKLECIMRSCGRPCKKGGLSRQTIGN